jgi:glycosyltransferase involved in cell wall biosynthesis
MTPALHRQNIAETDRPDAEPPLISIITVVFNGVAGIEATILSVINNASDRFEYLIIDGGSTDGTLDILRAYDSQLSYWVSEPDNGIYHAFNKGVSLARGVWVMFLGSGDLLHGPESMRNVVENLEHAPGDVQVAYGRVVTLTVGGSFVEEENGPWSELNREWKGGRKVMPHHQGIIQRRSFLETHPFDETYRIVADYKAFMQAIANFPPMYIDVVVAQVFVGGVTSLPRNSLFVAGEILRLNRELGSGYDHVPHQMFFFLKCTVKTVLSILIPARTTVKIIDAYRSATRRRKKWI